MKKRNLRYLVISVALLSLVAVGVGVFFRVRSLYQKAGVARFDVLEGTYTWNGKFFLSEDGETAVIYRSMERVKLEKVQRTNVDLTPYGFPGETFSYFLYNGYAICPDEGYEGLWPVSTPRRFLFRSGDGVFQIDTEQGQSWPVFADSVAGVPEDGGGLLAFSSNGSYALSLTGNTVTVYHTDPMDGSLRVVDVKSVDLSPLGKDAAFCAFTGEQYAAFTLTAEGRTVYAALNCESGEAVLCPTDFSVDRGQPLSRFFAQRPLSDKEKDKYCAAWTNLLLGTDTLCRGSEADLTLIAVSPEASHAAARGGDRVWILSEKRLFCLTDVLSGEQVQSVNFLEENVVAVSLLKDGASATWFYTVLF